MLDKLKIRKLMIFYLFSYIMDEISTLTILKMGGKEANPIITRMIGISPLLWILCDFIIFLSYYTMDIYLRDKASPKTLTAFWLIAGSARLSCAIWNYNQIRIHFLT